MTRVPFRVIIHKQKAGSSKKRLGEAYVLDVTEGDSCQLMSGRFLTAGWYDQTSFTQKTLLGDRRVECQRSETSCLLNT